MRTFNLMAIAIAFLLCTYGCTQPEALQAEYEPADCECEGDEEKTAESDEESSSEEESHAETSEDSDKEQKTDDEPETSDEEGDESTEVADEASNDDDDESEPGSATSGERVELNGASASELMSLPGVGPALAERIVEFRENRPFEKPEHLKRVKGIGEATFADLEPMIAVE